MSSPTSPPVRQFRVLYREFLFRALDLELLPQRGDMTRLLVQFGAMLAALSLILSGGVRRLAESTLPRHDLLIQSWPTENFLIATTMAAVALFAVLSWDSTFPDKRDVLVLTPLPVVPATLLRAKLAALATAMTLIVVSVNVFTGLGYPLVLGTGGLAGAARCLLAYWTTMLTAGIFVFCCVVSLQGLAAQLLTRRWFLRISGLLQLCAFALILGGYFLEPPLATPEAIADPGNRFLLTWLPQYWFLALFEKLNGSFPAEIAEFHGLLWRAWLGVAIAALAAAASLHAAYFRSLRKIAEEPDILPSMRTLRWPLALGGSLRAAVILFSARSLLRSRQHRVIMALYLGIGSALGLAYAKSILWRRSSFQWRAVNEPLIAATLILMCFAVLGVRAVFPLPLALRANWIFRITALRGPAEYLSAVRQAMFTLAVAPVWILSAALLFALWPWQAAATHLLILALVALILADLCLHGFHKIPFACSYLPGKANLHVTGAAYVTVFLAVTDLIAQTELQARRAPSRVALVVALVVFALYARLRTRRGMSAPEVSLQFEERPPSDIFAVQLHRDGAPLA